MAAHYRILLNDDGVDRLGGRDFTFVAFAGNITHRHAHSCAEHLYFTCAACNFHTAAKAEQNLLLWRKVRFSDPTGWKLDHDKSGRRLTVRGMEWCGWRREVLRRQHELRGAEVSIAIVVGVKMQQAYGLAGDLRHFAVPLDPSEPTFERRLAIGGGCHFAARRLPSLGCRCYRLSFFDDVSGDYLGSLGASLRVVNSARRHFVGFARFEYARGLTVDQ